jgi:sarcosine oxidase subunit delta
MRISCPYCGDRDAQEFVYRGDATPERPRDGANEHEVFEYLYLRNNVAGPMHENWYHAQGCRNWILVQRDTRTHEIHGVSLAKDGKR